MRRDLRWVKRECAPDDKNLKSKELRMSRLSFSLMALVVAAGCSGRDTAGPTSPAVRSSAAALSNAFPRSGALHVTKECSEYTRLAGGFCTITSSNLDEIEVGSKVIYAIASGPTILDSDVTLDLPGLGNNTAIGHVVLALAAGQGTVTFSGGTGKFTHFHANVAVTRIGAPALKTWSWDGTYSFSPRD